MQKYQSKNVFPTCVGMNRWPLGESNDHSRVPHMRGDEPFWTLLSNSRAMCSPHAWG